MKRILQSLLQAYPPLHLLGQLLKNRVGGAREDLESIHDRFIGTPGTRTVAVDLGCGLRPQNRFKATDFYGVDLYEDKSLNVFSTRLGFEKLPFDDEVLDYVTAYDLLEHIPRTGESPDGGNAPFIYLMNEIDRVLKVGGVFLSYTPVYPYLGAFTDPTHNNVMTVETLRLYFSNEKYEIARHYGIKCNFAVVYRKMLGQHLVCVLKK